MFKPPVCWIGWPVAGSMLPCERVSCVTSADGRYPPSGVLIVTGWFVIGSVYVYVAPTG